MATDAGIKSVPALIQFGKNLQQMGEQMYNVMQQAQRRLNEVSEGWRDDNNEKFKTRFDESVKTIKKMSEEFRAYNVWVQKKCEILNQYKNNSLNI